MVDPLPTTHPDAPRAGGETPIDLDATLAALKWAVSQSWINGGCKPPAPACSVMTGAEIFADYSATLATLRAALPSLLERQRDGELIDDLEALGVVTIHFRDGSELNPGSQSLRGCAPIREVLGPVSAPSAERASK